MPSTVTRERTSRIGASDAAAILGVSSYKTPYEVWLEKTKRAKPEGDSQFTGIGKKLEPIILDHAEEELGSLDRDIFIPAPGGLPLGATLDAQVLSTGDVVEAKTSGMTKGAPVVGYWGEEGTDHIPQEYLVQTQLQMFCAGAEVAHVYALLGGWPVVKYLVRYDKELASILTEQLTQWWHTHIIGDIPPDASTVTPEILKRVIRQPESVIEIDQTATFRLRTIIDDLEMAKAKKKEIEEQAELLQGQLILALGDAEAAKLADGTQITYLESHRKGYTVQPKSYRTLRIKEAK
jgi:putative phage-type endonuclease